MARKFLVIFGAEDEVRLSPCKDDKPKMTKICCHKALRGRASLALKGRSRLENLPVTGF